MKPGRIEVYIHSDMTTQNKGVGVFQLISETDFVTKDEVFLEVCKRGAMLAFAIGARSWEDLTTEQARIMYDVTKALNDLEVYLGEALEVGEIWSLTL